MVALRSEPAKAVLIKAINARQNAYYAKYGNASAIISLMNQYYSSSNANSKPNRLQALSELSELQATTLQAAYIANGKEGVVKTTAAFLSRSQKAREPQRKTDRVGH